ncbi:MAG: glucose-1-phosphate thymidylyltransferase [Conexivisphaera sp.]
MKGVILHGGKGTRLRPLTFSGPKQLIPVANKPVSQHVLEDLVSSGITDVAIVLGDTFPQLVGEYYGDGSRFGARITYIYQGEALGIAHAVKLAEDYVGDEPFVVCLGDNLIQGGISKYVERFRGSGLDAMVLLKEVEDPRSFGVAEVENGRILRLVEKPREPRSNLALIGVYFLTKKVFDVIRDLRPSWRGELEITDALQGMVERGYSVGYAVHEGWWLDTGKKDDILLANQLVLDEKATRSIAEGVELRGSRVDGRAIISEEARIIDSTIVGPAAIGRGAVIENSHVGPFTSIGPGVHLRNAKIDYSVVMEGSRVENVELDRCLVGRNVVIRGREGNRSRLRVSLGDYSVLEVE